jgi:transposase
MSSTSDRVVIGVDPHKRSATIEVMTADESVAGGGRFGTDRDGYAAMLRYGKQWPDRVWAIEGCAGIGKHIAHRLLADRWLIGDTHPDVLGSGPVLSAFPAGVGKSRRSTHRAVPRTAAPGPSAPTRARPRRGACS